MRTSVVVRVAVATAAVLAGMTALAGPAGAMRPAPTHSRSDFEIDFMADTIDHHFLALKMAQMCLDKATPAPPGSDTRLRELCQANLEDQTREIAKLQSWLRDWYGISKRPMLPPNGDDMLAMLRSRRGEAFDMAIAQAFIQHHLKFLPRADRCRDTASHDVLRNLCDTMFRTQRAQIESFERVFDQHAAMPQSGPSQA
ncbi:MAG: DUF305 domain-containing protein [Actinobacteria bacterium]|nr:DUF305 domain-containing protein [Actinomycetota bacterium]